MQTFLTRKIDELGRIVLPQSARESLHLSEGEAVKISWEEDKIVIRKATPTCKICGAASELNDMGVCKFCVEKIKAE